MRETIILMAKGFLIGIGKIIPGVSGAMLAISLGLYEKGITAISHLFQNIKENMWFLIRCGSGVFLAILLFSKVIHFTLSHYYLPTMLLFIGMIAGSIPSIFRKVKTYRKPSYYVITIIVMLLLFLITLETSGSTKLHPASLSSVIYFFFMGIIDAATIIIPGISGTAILMNLGCYEEIIGALSNFANPNNFYILIPLGFGLGTGILLLSKIMHFLFEKMEMPLYYAILGFATTSLAMMFLETLGPTYSFTEVLFSLFLLVIGYQIGKRFDN